tara:strand:- start:192 stop:473 length:282 start_codon:yes stop_codon:yes gene_type:complete
MEIAIICLIILNIGINIFLIRILANLTVNSFQKLNSELSDAITQVIEGSQSINMPEINPLQMMVMELIKKNMNQQPKTPDLELLREKDGKFKK